MNLKYINEYKSILPYEDVELENFSVLTGLNGSGKSHLLESIKNGNSKVDNIPFSEVVLFDYKTFFLENENAFNSQQINKEKQNTWGLLTGTNRPNGSPDIHGILQTLKINMGETRYSEIRTIANGRPFLLVPNEDFQGDDSLLSVYNEYKQQINNLFNNPQLRFGLEATGLKSLALSIDKTLDDLTEDEFFDFYSPLSLKNNFLPSQIGKLFLDYWYKYQMFQYEYVLENKIYNEESIRQKFEKKHGPRPWFLIESILQSFESFKYCINNPENIIIKPDRNTTFSVALKNKLNGITIPFNDLSSGEKILFSLVLSIYKSEGDKLFPSVLLLDEIDASLHPSQIQNLLNVINDVFVSRNNVKVIIATHSPTTIALAEEKNIYVVNMTGPERIQKQTKKDALQILSEGFITLDEGLQIFDQIAKKELTIFTEGNNISYIERAITLMTPELLPKIEIIKDLKDRTGKNQLQMLFEFFTRMPHSKKVLFIFDCDVTNQLTDTDNTYSFIFEKNTSNRKVVKGIENLFAQELFTPEYYCTKPKEDGGTQSSLDKPKFERLIMERNNAEDFLNFNILLSKLKNMLP